MERAMITNNIPYQVSGGKSFFARAEIKDIMAYLRLISNNDDDNALLRIVNVPRREIGAGTLEKLGTTASEEDSSLFAAATSKKFCEQITARREKILQRFVELINDIKKQCEATNLEAALDKLMTAIGYKEWLLDTSSNEKIAGYRWQNVKELLRWIANMQVDNEGQPQSLSTIINKLMLRDMLDQKQSENEQQVELMTLHAAKGLEFPNVYLIGMEEELLPHRSSIEEDNIDEERRLAYVGITRAEKNLTITLTKTRRRFGELVRCEPSRFLHELPEEDLQWEGRASDRSSEEIKENNQARLASLRAMLKS